jgi:hypothetical protein
MSYNYNLYLEAYRHIEPRSKEACELAEQIMLIVASMKDYRGLFTGEIIPPPVAIEIANYLCP